MKTIVIEVGDLLTGMEPRRSRRRIGEVPGVESVSVDHAAKAPRSQYDETRIKVADIKSLVQRPGPDFAAPPAASTGEGHEGHATAEALPESQDPRPAMQDTETMTSTRGTPPRCSGIGSGFRSPSRFRWSSGRPISRNSSATGPPRFPDRTGSGPCSLRPSSSTAVLVFLQGAWRELSPDCRG